MHNCWSGFCLGPVRHWTVLSVRRCESQIWMATCPFSLRILYFFKHLENNHGFSKKLWIQWSKANIVFNLLHHKALHVINFCVLVAKFTFIIGNVLIQHQISGPLCKNCLCTRTWSSTKLVYPINSTDIWINGGRCTPNHVPKLSFFVYPNLNICYLSHNVN